MLRVGKSRFMPRFKSDTYSRTVKHHSMRITTLQAKIPNLPLLLVYERPQQYQQVTDSTFHLSHLKRWFDLSAIQFAIQKANSRRCA